MIKKLATTILLGPQEPFFKECLASISSISSHIVVVYDPNRVQEENLDLISGEKFSRVEHEWAWDFSLARNLAIDNVHHDTDWILWLDCDDILEDETRQAIESRLDDIDSDIGAIELKYIYSFDQQDNAQIVLFRERLFRHNIGCHWEYPVHEVVDIPDSYKTIQWDEAIIHKNANPKSFQRADQQVEILKLAVGEYESEHGKSHRKTLRMLYYLVREIATCSNQEEASGYAKEFLKRSTSKQERADVCYHMARISTSLRSPANAVIWSEKAIEELPNWDEAHFYRGLLAYDKKDWPKVVDSMQNALACEDESQIVFYRNEAIRKYEAYDYLSFAEGELGNVGEAIDGAKKYLESHIDERIQRNLNYWQTLLVKPKKVTTRLKGVVAFFVGYHYHDWNATALNDEGIHGRETSNACMAIEFARLGFKVVIFCQCQSCEGFFDDVEYLHFEKFHAWCDENNPDIVFSSGQLWIFDQPVRAKKRILWFHDSDLGKTHDEAPGLFPTEERKAQIDAYFFMSEWQRDNILDMYQLDGDHYVTRSGIKLDRYDDIGQNIEKQRHRCIYSSSPDRGLERLLNMWPSIHESVPESTLHVFYGFNNFKDSIPDHPDPERSQQWYDQMMTRLLTMPGVSYYGRVDQKRLAIEFSKSSVWLYPTHFTETMCLSALEAMAGDCVPLTTNLGALSTTVGDGGILLDFSEDDQSYREVFTEEAIRLLTDDDYWSHWLKRGKAQLTEYWDWGTIASEWEEYLAAGSPLTTGWSGGNESVDVGARHASPLHELLDATHRHSVDHLTGHIPPKGHLIFFISHYEHPTLPTRWESSGFSGGIHAILKLAISFKKLGWWVMVVGTVPDGEVTIDGIIYRDRSRWEETETENVDVLITDGLGLMSPVRKARLNIYWMLNSVFLAGDTQAKVLDWADKIVTSSRVAAHQQQLVPAEKLSVLPLGIDRDCVVAAKEFAQGQKLDATHLIASGNGGAYRENFWKMLDAVKNHIPKLTLTITACDSDQLPLPDWVNVIGKVGEQEYLDLLATHQLWIYPSGNPDTFSISSYEAIACGCLPVVSNWASVSETVSSFGEIVPGIPCTEIFWSNYENTLKTLILNDEYRHATRSRLKTFDIDLASWDRVAVEWEAFIKASLSQIGYPLWELDKIFTRRMIGEAIDWIDDSMCHTASHALLKEATEARRNFMQNRDGYSEFYDDYNQPYGADQSIAFYEKNPRTSELISLLQTFGAKNVLDAGSRFGELTQQVAKAGIRCIGIECSEAAVTRAIEALPETLKPLCEFHHGYVEDVCKITDERFDAVWCGEILEHVQDVRVFVRNISACLNKNGVIIASFPSEYYEFFVSRPSDEIEGTGRVMKLEPKGIAHLRAFRIEDMLEIFRDNVIIYTIDGNFHGFFMVAKKLSEEIFNEQAYHCR